MYRSALLVLLVACGGSEPMEPEILSFVVDPEVAAQGEEVTATFELAHFTLTGEEGHAHEEDGMGDMDGMEDGEHEGHDSHDGETQMGHVHIYLDDLETNPLAMQTELVGTFIVPEDTEIGEHTLIARLHDSDHLIIEPQVTAEFDLDVMASGSGTTP